MIVITQMKNLKRNRNFSCMISLILFTSALALIQNTNEVLTNVKKLDKFKCSQAFCENILCEKVECPDGVLIPKGSFCHCCDICIKISFKGLNDSCDETVSRSFNVIAESKCKRGLKCENGKCIWNGNTSSCLYQRYLREQRESTDNYKETLWKPKCDYKGNYVAKQEKERKSMCVDEAGTRIFGTGKNKNGSCECSRYMLKKQLKNPLLHSIRAQEHCSTSGNFDSLQCINDLCYCADVQSGDVNGMIVRREFLDKLPCSGNANFEKDYIKSCERELLRSRSLAYQLIQKGVKLLGIERVECDPDGTFSPKQCNADRCVCTNNEGVGIESYYTEEDELAQLNINMSCSCARDEKVTQSLSQSSTIKCDKYGNYQSVQCFGNKCECTDEDGESISKPMDRKVIKLDYCNKMLQKLQILPVDDNDDEYDDPTDDDYYDYI